MIMRLTCAVFALCLASAAWSQSAQRLDVPVNQGTMAAWLRLPATSQRIPAVVVAHGSNGLDGRSVPYLKALNAAGIATFEIEMFSAGQRPSSVRDREPHAIAALRYLASSSSIDQRRIGMMGMSFGGALSLRMAEERTYPPSSPLRYAALLGLYPACFSFVDGPASKAGVLSSPTSRPLLILSGTADDYDAPDDCQKVVNLVNAKKPGTATVHMYPGATHQWDSARGAVQFRDSAARRGHGGTVAVIPDATVTADAVARTAAFFAKMPAN